VLGNSIKLIIQIEMLTNQAARRRQFVLWLARLGIGLVFALNVSCAIVFLIRPDSYAPAFELSGVPGRILVRGIGVLFLMWNATYPLVIMHPDRQRTLFAIILVQQAIGVVGEVWIWLSMPPGHAALHTTGLRFIIFDGLGLLGMWIIFWLLRRSSIQSAS
jgi:hypothetical protein